MSAKNDRPAVEVVGAGIGREIRAARRHADLTLKQLGELTGLSHSYLSEVENGHSQLSINNLYVVAEALGTTPRDLLITEDRSLVSVVRADEGIRPDVEPQTRVLVNGPHRELESMEYVLQPGYDTGVFEHTGDELFYVLEGTIAVQVGSAPSVELSVGDTISYPATTPHRLTVVGDQTARVLIVMSHVARPAERHH
ncbi:cupin domain-containing protein [soil metagenome]